MSGSFDISSNRARSPERVRTFFRPSRTSILETPLNTGPYPIDGKSLKDLAEGLPLFSPIEGLDETVWKDKQCGTCHQWDKVTLCDLGEVYARSDPAHMLRKQHPYGGPFKLALRNWSEAGCK